MLFSDTGRPTSELSFERVCHPSSQPRYAALTLALGMATLLGMGCASSTSSATARNAAGVESFSSGRYDDAIGYFQDSLEENPSNAETYYNLASAYQRKATETGDTVLLGQAEDAYWTALEHNPKSDTIVCCYRGLATSAMARGDANGALQTLEAWRDRNPDSIEPKLEIAYLLEAQQKDAEAYDVLKEVAAEAPNDYRAYYKMGVLAERAGDLSDAMENAQAARQLNPTDATVAQRVNNLQTQIAAQERKEKEAEQQEEKETALAKAEFADPAASIDPSQVQTTPVQTTSAQSQENEGVPQTEMVLPEDASSGIPTSNYRSVPSTNNPIAQTSAVQESDKSLGFGAPVATGGETTSAAQNAKRADDADDDADVKWISSTNAERVRRQIAQTSATTPADSATGFVNVNNDGTGAASQKVPSKTVTTAQFETPAFAVGQTNTTAVAANAAQASAPQTAAPQTAQAVVPATPTTAQATTTSSPAEVKPRAELHSGPPRLSAGAFF